MIQILNNSLEKENNQLAKNYKIQKYPIYFIVAQPRGASTLFQQLILSNIEIGYISNFLAKFYKAPIIGAFLEKDVIDKDYKSDFISNYGNTTNINEPHEWGWFWQYHLGLKDNEHYTKKRNFEPLKYNLNGVIEIKNKPLIIDNVFAMSNILKLKEFLDIKIIYTSRDLYYICNSIINARISRYNDINTFYGHRPKNMKEILKIQNPIEQIVYQVKSIQNEIDTILANFDENDIFRIDYEDIYHNTYGVVEKFYDFLQKDNIILNKKERHLPKLSYRNDPKLIKPEFKKELDYYYHKYFKGKI